MKKFMILAICLVVLVGMSMAQTYTGGATGITGVDKLGAHQNGGRGCTGCHAPHSGGKGGGGNAAANAAAFNDPTSGDQALFGQDVTPLYSVTLNFGSSGAYSETLPANSATSSNDLTGVAFCLACHDGNIAKGGMMTGKSYEQTQTLLPVGVYGPNAIPTLLGNDGTTAGNYNNDHPVGPAANLKAVGVSTWFTLNGTSLALNTANASYAASYGVFVSHYGNFFQGRATVAVPSGATTSDTAYVICTTCHTPHSMYTATGTWGGVSGTYPTYFFLVAPYNPGSNPSATQASSATQFCRSCHYTGAGGANEGSGITTVTTAF